MNLRNTTLATLTAAVLILAAPAAAQAEYYVPPENSAANQYTEAFPTGGGDRETGEGTQGKRRSASEVLGERGASRLNAQGPEGRAVAGIVSATAPEIETEEEGGAAAGGKSKGGGGSSPTSADKGRGLPDGSSGLGEIVGHATGSSSTGGLGLLLPLAIAAAAAWALAYLWKQRSRATP